ncbi:hypothetical protein CTI12_AA424490 [Artemisia annua]|uniref:Uncharacterized protein n=1 Tax=Artemisia annua TaxID=35608 RepID=A0A2U1M3N1_ARTAN|nr:hypothetical protein CTI12_AA424490 [Artemisia annua]
MLFGEQVPEARGHDTLSMSTYMDWFCLLMKISCNKYYETNDIPMNGMVSDYKNGLLVTCLGIPMIYGIDIVHVHNNVYKAICFPHNIGLRVTRDPLLIKKIGAATALEISQNHC